MLTDSFLLFIFLAGASINFIPYFLGYSLKDPETNEYPDFIVALSDSKYAASIIFSLSTMLPILLDSICDFLIHKFSKDKETLFNISPINIPFREIIFILIIPDILLLLWIFPCSKYDLIAPLIASRDTMYIFCFLAYLVKFGNRIWTQSTIVLIGGPLMITNVFITCEVLLSDYSPYQDAYQVITPTLISLALAAVTITLMRWYYYMIYEKDYSEIVLESARSKNDFMCTIFCTLLGMYLYLDWVIFYIPQPISSTWSYIGPDYLSMDNYLMAGCTLCMTTLINRFARVDAIDSRRMLRIKQMFMRYISHELRTPLNIAFLGLKILHDELKRLNLSVLLTTLKDTQESCMVALEILNDMLLYDTISSGVLVMQKKVIDPIAFFTRAIKPFRTEAREKGIDLILKQNVQSDASIRLKGDPQKLALVIRNILSNALKFTDRGGVVTLSISLEEDDEEENGYANGDIEVGLSSRYFRRSSGVVAALPRQLVISVSDTGIGISKEKQLTLFNGVVNFTPGTIEKGQGSGLGLFISKQIVDQHGGTISVRSLGENAGSTFIIVLPLQSSNGESGEDLFDLRPRDYISFIPSETPETSRNMRPMTANNVNESVSLELESKSKSKEPMLSDTVDQVLMFTNSRSDHSEGCNNDNNDDVPTVAVEKALLSVLIVDDSAMSRRMVCRILLASERFHCEQADDGRIAVEMVQQRMIQGKYDMILMDYQMPNIDGPTAIAEIRKLGFTGVILGLTGNALQSDIDCMMAAGANGVLLKPLSMDIFWKTLNSLS